MLVFPLSATVLTFINKFFFVPFKVYYMRKIILQQPVFFNYLFSLISLYDPDWLFFYFKNSCLQFNSNTKAFLFNL